MAEAPTEVRLAQTGVDRHRGFDELIDFYGGDIPDSGEGRERGVPEGG
jgi:hypothetical protein